MNTLWDDIADTRTNAQKFMDFDRDNPEVYQQLKMLAFSLIDKGINRYGIAALFEVLRYHSAIETNDPDFKLNNNHKAFYARKFIADFPCYKDFFELRERKAVTDG